MADDGLLADKKALRVLTLAAQALAAELDNYQMRVELDWSHIATTLLQRISRLVNSSLDLTTIFEAIVNDLADIGGYPAAAIFRLRGDILVCEAKRSEIDQHAIESLPISQGITGRAVRSGKTLWIPNVVEDPDYLFTVSNVVSHVSVPFLKDGRVLGVLNIGGTSDRSIHQRDVSLLEALAEQITVAMENAHLHSEAQRRLAELESLWSVSVDVGATLELGELLNLVVQRAVVITGAAGGSILLVEEGQNDLHLAATYNTNNEVGRRRQSKGVVGLVLQTGVPQIVNDYPNWSDHVPNASRQGIYAVMGIPLKWGHTILGVLVLIQTQPERKFDASIIQSVSLFAAQAASAIHTARLYEAEQRKARQLSAIHQINRQITLSLKPDDLIHRLVTLVKNHFGYEHVCLYLVENDIAHPVAGDAHRKPIAAGAGIIGWVAQMGQSLLMRQVEATAPLVDHGTLATTQAQLTIPLVHAGRVLGVLDIQNEVPNSLDEVDELAVGTVSSQAAVALVNAQNYANTARLAEELSALYTTSQAVAADLALNEVLQTIVDQACVLIDAIAARIRLLTPDQQERVCVAQTAEATEIHINHRVPATAGITGQVILTGEALLVQDVATDPRMLETGRISGASSLICVPLIVQGRIIGELTIINRRNGRKFTEQDLRLMRIFAQQASSAMHNAQLYETERRRVQQLGLANRIARLTSASLNEEEILETVVRGLTDDLGFAGASILLKDPASDTLEVKAFRGPDEFKLSVGARFPVTGGLAGEAIRTGEAVLANDTYTDSRVRRTATFKTPPSIATAPLRTGDEIHGVLYVAGSSVNAFGPNDVFLIQAIADQVAATMQSALLYRAEQERVRRLRMSNELASLTSASLDVDEIVQTTTRILTEGMGFDTSTIALYDRDTDRLVIRAVGGHEIGVVPIGWGFPAHEGLSGYAFRHNEVVYTNNARQDQRTLVFTGGSVMAVLATPLRSNDGVLGVLRVANEQPNTLSEADKAIVQSVADQVAATIAAANAYKLEQERVQRLRVSNQIARVTTASLNVDDILETTAQSLVEGMGFDCASIVLHEPRTNQLVVRATSGQLSTLKRAGRVDPTQGLSGLAFTSGEAIFTNNASNDRRMVIDTANLVESVLAVPLRSSDRIVGVLQVAYQKVNCITETDVALMQSVADQLTAALSTALLYEVEQKRVRQLRLANQLARTTTAALDVDEVIQTVVQTLNQELAFHQITVVLYDPTTNELVVHGLSGGLVDFPTLGFRITPDTGITGLAFSTGEVIVVPYASQDPRIYQVTAYPAESVLAVPLRQGDVVMGVLHIAHREPDYFTPVDVAVVQAMADQLAVAIKAASLYQAEQKRVRQLRLANQIARQTTASLDLNEILWTTTHALTDDLDFYSAFIALPDQGTGDLVVRAVGGSENQVLLGYRFKSGMSLIGRAIQTGEIIISNEASIDARIVKIQDSLPGSMLAIPLRQGAEILGVLQVAQKEARQFDPTDVAVIQTIADQLAAALKAAQLYEAEQERVRQLGLANSIARLTTASLDVEDVIVTTVRTLHEELGFFHASVALYDAHSSKFVVRATSGGLAQHIYPGLHVPTEQGAAGRAFKTGKTIIVNDAQTNPLVYRNSLYTLPGSILIVPLTRGEQKFGVLQIAQELPNQFTAGVVAVIQAVADQLTAALTAAELYEDERRKTWQLQAIHNINREIAATLDRDELIQRVARLVHEQFSYTYVGLYLLENEKLMLGAGRVGDTGPLTPDLLERTLKTGLPYLNRVPGPAVTSYAPAVAELAVPIALGDNILGILYVRNDAPAYLDQVDLLTLGAVVSQTAVSLVNAENYSGTVRRAEELSALYATVQAVVSQLSFNDVLRTIAERAVELTGAAGAQISMITSDKTERVVVAGVGRPVQIGFRTAVHSGLAGQVIASGKAILNNSLSSEPNILSHAREVGLKAVIAAPLRIKGEVIGLLSALNDEQGRHFTERDLCLLEVFAQQAALAINNAQLFSAEQSLVRQLDLANRIARLTTGALNVDDVLQTTVRSLVRDLGFFTATVLLHDTQTQELVVRAVFSDGRLADRTGTRFSARLGVTGAALQNGEVIISNDADNDSRIYFINQETEIRSVMAVPLRLADEVIGVLHVGSTELNRFGPNDVAILTAVADQVAAALTAARLYSETHAARQQAETILQTAQAGLVVLDDNWRVVTLNPAAEEIIGKTRATARGKSLTQLIGADLARQLKKWSTDQMNGSAVDHHKMMDAQLTGRGKDVLIGVAPIQPGYLLSLLDVTALKEVDRLKSEIVANFSHELRAPLASIKAYTELLLDYNQPESELPKEFLSVVNQETDRLTELINDVLDLSRLEAGRPEMEFSSVPISQVVDEVVRMFNVQAQAKGVTFKVQTARGVRPFWGDRQLLGMLLRNLIGNAVKYNRPGGGVEVLIDEITQAIGLETCLRLRIRDTGVGIPAHAMPHLFEKFFRVRSTTESGIQGTGLGLPLVKAAVEAHRGEISVTSAEGVGTEFTVLLPITTIITSTRLTKKTDS